MCGIAGFVNFHQHTQSSLQVIERMCEVIHHRGPDDQGVWTDDGLALGMRRLAIIDLAGGHQPIWNEDHSVLVVYNGEIYNHVELRQQLQQQGHQFSTVCDTEVIVHAYEEYGAACPRYLRGMFCLALWDARRQRLLLARDRFGKKPLNYYWDGQQLIFGSEIKSILATGIARELNPQALDDYLLYRYVPAPHTIFQNIFKLPAAHTLIWEQGTIKIERYWDLPFAPVCHDDEQTAIERTRELLRDAVKVRLMSDVPLGAFLSGGVDSSLVVGLMSQLLEQPVKTFSIGFVEDGYSELSYARQVAQHFHTEHHEFCVRPDLIEVLPRLVWACDEPFADSSMLPTYYVSKLAREHVTVVLTGDGGDEIFGGYTRYESEWALQRIPAFVRRALSYGSDFLPAGTRGKKFLHKLRYDLPARYVHRLQKFPLMSTPIFEPDFVAQLQQHDPYAHLLGVFATMQAEQDTVTRLQYVDTRVYLPDDILVKVDKMSMINSLETRAPLLDQHLAAYVTSLPPHIRLKRGLLKALLKQAATNMLPPEILTRSKQGFGIPLKHWLRTDLRAYAWDMLTSTRARQRGIFRPHYVERLLNDHANIAHVDYSGAIWALLCLELWFQAYMDAPSLIMQEEIFTVKSGC